MLVVLHATGTGPCACKALTITTFFPLTCFGIPVMLFEGVFTQALEIISSVSGNVLECFTFAAFGVAVGFAVLWVQVFMLLEPVVTEAFGFGTDHFALVVLGVFPAEVQSVGILMLLGWSMGHDVEFLVVVDFD